MNARTLAMSPNVVGHARRHEWCVGYPRHPSHPMRASSSGEPAVVMKSSEQWESLDLGSSAQRLWRRGRGAERGWVLLIDP